MPDRGAKRPLAAYIDVKHGFAFEGQYFCDEPMTHVLMTPGNFAIGGGFQEGKAKYYKGPIPEDFILRQGDLVVTMTDLSKAGDTLGYPALVPAAHNRIYLHNQRIGLVSITDPESIDRDYLYYVLRTDTYRNHVLATASGSTVRHTSPSRIREFQVQLPAFKEQQAAAAVLRLLDDKIDQNRRTGRALEALARATFKAWFVDFEPVKAKAAGQTGFPGMRTAAFAAFPDRLTDSPLGPVPQGWEVVDVYQLAKVVYGAPFASKLFNETGEGRPLIRIRDLQTHSPSISTTEQHPKGTLIRPGEIVVGMDGEFRLHYWTGPEAWLNQRLCSFKPLPEVPTMYLGEALRAPLDYVERSEAATTVIHLGKHDIERFELLRPDRATLAAFDNITSPVLDLIVQMAAESSKLATLRDYLLPRLLSGRVRVRDAVDAIEQAA